MNELLPLAEVERRHILLVLRACNYHRDKTAHVLQISPKTLYRKLRELKPDVEAMLAADLGGPS